MYHKCRLVHADFSEYNILYYKGHLWIIDVSQSVEHDHPNALVFLRKDCENVGDFFRKHSVSVMSTRELFDFITDPTIEDEGIDDYLDKLQHLTESRDSLSTQQLIDEAVFKKAHIPRTLTEVVHLERDLQKAKEGTTNELYYLTLTGMKHELHDPHHHQSSSSSSSVNQILEHSASNGDSSSHHVSLNESTSFFFFSFFSTTLYIANRDALLHALFCVGCHCGHRK
jgi:RIO kinase 1